MGLCCEIVYLYTFVLRKISQGVDHGDNIGHIKFSENKPIMANEVLNSLCL